MLGYTENIDLGQQNTIFLSCYSCQSISIRILQTAGVCPQTSRLHEVPLAVTPTHVYLSPHQDSVPPSCVKQFRLFPTTKYTFIN